MIYPVEGSPLIIGPNGVLKSAPNPNAARLFQNFMLSAECQQFNVDFGGLRSAHKLVKDKPGRKPLSGNQGDEGRRGRGRKRKRADQSPLRTDLQGMKGHDMRDNRFTRRDILKGTTALAVGTTVFAEPLRAAPPPAEAITPH